MTLLKDLIDIPERVHQGDYVLRLSEGVTRSAETLKTYVVTPDLVTAFESSLNLVKAALLERSSKGAFLHGSFGSGKSHFMAVLYLLLGRDPDARSIPELAPLVAGNESWLAGKKFLLVPYHMIGEKNLESAVLGRYVEHVRRLHPDAQTPQVYLDDGILQNARELRKSQGDQQFFQILNAAPTASGSGGGWGKLASTWTAASFEEACRAPHGSPARGRLVSDVLRTLLTAYRGIAAGSGEGFVSLDVGLSEISKHAASLGYDGLVLFLDELILWLLSHMADQAFVEKEGSKLVKLVEASQEERPVPIISFVARQRDLKELVGEHVPGAEKQSFAETLEHMKGRFDIVRLYDRDLPAIVEKRLLLPKSEAARQLVSEAFAGTEKYRAEVLSTLLGKSGNSRMFRQVYPFSPALVDTLVAVSSVLQRERTAIKLLVQLLVSQRETLKLGDVVPVGDLFDILASGDEPFSQEMKAHFVEARKLWEQKLLPMLEARHGTTAEALAKLPPGDARAMAFLGDERILKTLLLASLAPEVEALRELTASRLTALNHGSIRSPIPGKEAQDVARKCREWAAQVGAIRVTGETANPTISIQIAGIEVDAILEKAQAEDNPGNRRLKLRELLFDRLGIPVTDGFFTRYELLWRGTRRSVEVMFENVRKVTDDVLRVKGDDWKVILDFPFDPEQKGPNDDLARLEDFRAQGSSQVLCWLPSFFGTASQADLGRLVILDHILKGERLLQYTRELSDVVRAAARAEMENLQSRLRERLAIDLEMAYGVRTDVDPTRIDRAHDLSEHLQSLDPSFRPRPPIGANLAEAFEKLVGQIFAHVYPAHPDFEEEVKTAAVKRVHEVVRLATEVADHRILVERPMRDPIRRVAMPLKVGTMYEEAFVLDNHWVNHFTKKAAQEASGPLTVGRLRKWMDDPKPMGLPRELSDFVILMFAEQSRMTFFLSGGPVDGGIGLLKDDFVLREQPLPAPEDWNLARTRAAAVFGLTTLGSHLSPSNVAALVDKVKQEANALAEAARDLTREVATRSRLLGFADETPRFASARAAADLLNSLRRVPDGEVVATLARAVIPSSPEALGRSIRSASAVQKALLATNWEVFQTASQLTGSAGEAASRIVARVKEAAAKDELAVGLEPVLVTEYQAAWKLIQESVIRAAPPQPPIQPAQLIPPPPLPIVVPPPIDPRPLSVPDSGERTLSSAAEARDLFGKLESNLAADPGVRLTVVWKVERGGGTL